MTTGRIYGTCETCRFYDTSANLRDAEPDTTGQCRRWPPSADDRTGRAMWPFVEDEDWCGEHQEESAYALSKMHDDEIPF